MTGGRLVTTTGKERSSIHDVARLCNVSVSTVSRVVNNKGRISPATRERVLKAVEEVGYVTNAAARSLRMASSKTVGIIVPDISDDWLAQMVSALERRLFDAGYSTLICNSDRDEEKEAAYIRSLDAKCVDGIICVAGIAAFPADELVREVPVICIDRRPRGLETVFSVESDHFAGGYLAGTELAETGCTRCAFVSRSLELSTDHLRHRGFCQALHDHGIVPDGRLLIRIDPRLPSYEGARDAVAQLLERGERPDGVFATNDWRALGTIAALEEHGLSVPRDVRVVGFDDSPIAAVTRPAITSVRQDVPGIARKATELLLALAEGTAERTSERHVIVPVRLIRRESTATS